MNQPVISKNVWRLSMVSLFTDMASEMLYPVMPVYLQSIGFSVLLIGILEGVSEAVAGLSKGYFGNLSDRMNRRLPFVQTGYTLSAISKPMLAVSTWPIWVFLSRAIDRLGKGIRTGARDALLSDETTAATKGRVFGFHRSMDTIGAVIGPLIAIVFLYFLPGQYAGLFLFACIPGLIAVVFTRRIREKKQKSSQSQRPGFLDYVRYYKQAPVEYKRLVTGLLVFSLFNSSDVFLLLAVKEAGFSDLQALMMYVLYNLSYVLFSYPMGTWADAAGKKRVLVTGFLLFAFTYCGFSFCTQASVFIVLFFLYGLYAAATEGISKAWVSAVCPSEEMATAIGSLAAGQSVASLLASTLAGWVWFNFGHSVTFLVTALMTVLVAIYISVWVKEMK